MTNIMNEMYRDIIMEHYRDPRGRKHVTSPDITNEGHNPLCGDEVELAISLDGDRINELGIHCVGCAISTASGSILSELVEGKTIDEIKRIAEHVKAYLTGEIDELPDDDMGDLEVLQGVKQFPVRIKCALLAWTTLIESIEHWEHDKKK